MVAASFDTHARDILLNREPDKKNRYRFNNERRRRDSIKSLFDESGPKKIRSTKIALNNGLS